MRSQRHNKVLLLRMTVILSIMLFLLSLTQNSFCRPSDCNAWPGWGLLLVGWLEIMNIDKVGPFVGLAWFANPCLAAAWISTFLGQGHRAIGYAGAGLILGLGFLFGNSVVGVEGGGLEPITRYAVGYWIWIGGLAVALCAAITSSLPRTPRPAA
jgi:hypothetical protein